MNRTFGRAACAWRAQSRPGVAAAIAPNTRVVSVCFPNNPTGKVIDEASLRVLCDDAYDYDVPLEKVYDRVHVMRLDRGPTASFKDRASSVGVAR